MQKIESGASIKAKKWRQGRRAMEAGGQGAGTRLVALWADGKANAQEDKLKAANTADNHVPVLLKTRDLFQGTFKTLKKY